jgi:hypothetical protein
MQQSLAVVSARCDAEVADRDDPSDGALPPATAQRSHGAVFVDYPQLGEEHDPSDHLPPHADVDQPLVQTQGVPSGESASPAATTDDTSDQSYEAWALALAADDELARDLECPIRRARAILIGMGLGAIMWAVMLGAGALVIYG